MIGYIYLTTNDVNNICYVGKRQKPSFDRTYRGPGTRLAYAHISECCKGYRKTAYGYRWEVVEI